MHTSNVRKSKQRTVPFFSFNDAEHSDDDGRLHADWNDRSVENKPQLLAEQLHWTIHVGKVLENKLRISNTEW